MVRRVVRRVITTGLVDVQTNKGGNILLFYSAYIDKRSASWINIFIGFHTGTGTCPGISLILTLFCGPKLTHYGSLLFRDDQGLFHDKAEEFLGFKP